MAKYNIYPGKYICHTCMAEVKTMSSYPATKELTWMCADKHLSTVSLQTKKKARDFE